MTDIVPQRFFLMRHAETTDNARKVVSNNDIDLTLEGVEQAKCGAIAYEHLPTKPFPIITSGWKRTNHTAEIVTGHASFTEDNELRERGIGAGGEMTEEESRSNPRPDEEKHAAHQARVITALNRHLSEAEEQHKVENRGKRDHVPIPMVVAHSGTIHRIFTSMGLDKLTDVKNANFYECVPFIGQESGKVQWKVFEISPVVDPLGKPHLQKKDITPQRGADFYR